MHREGGQQDIGVEAEEDTATVEEGGEVAQGALVAAAGVAGGERWGDRERAGRGCGMGRGRRLTAEVDCFSWKPSIDLAAPT
jgi:hypothetical protein